MRWWVSPCFLQFYFRLTSEPAVWCEIILLSIPSAEQECSPQTCLQTISRSLPEIGPLILKCRYQASHSPLAAERSFFGAGRWQGSAYKGLGRRGDFEVRWLPSCPRCASLIAFISNNISWRQAFLGNKSGDCCNPCDGLPRCVSHYKYVGIKEYVFLAPDMKTNSVLTVNQ